MKICISTLDLDRKDETIYINNLEHYSTIKV